MARKIGYGRELDHPTLCHTYTAIYDEATQIVVVFTKWVELSLKDILEN